ncbi:MAG: hypothetical protein GX903_08350 [Spirochaetales bacterium]|nr:hypothetical protein [Spirochaetales bacterium]
MIILLLSLGLIFTLIAQNNIRNNIFGNNRMLLQQYRYYIEEVADIYKNTTLSLASTSDAVYLLTEKQIDDSTRFMKLNSIFEKYITKYQSIDSIYYYNPNTDKVYFNDYKLYNKQLNSDIEQIIRKTQDFPILSPIFHKVENAKTMVKEEKIIASYLLKIPTNKNLKNPILMLNIDDSFITNLTNKSNQLFFIANGKDIITKNIDNLALYQKVFEKYNSIPHEEDFDLFTLKVSSNRYLCSYITMKGNQNIFLIDNFNEVFKGVFTILYIYISIISLAIIILFFLTKSITQKAYSPLNNILNKISEIDNDTVIDEISILDDKIDQYKNKEEELEILKTETPSLIKSLIKELLLTTTPSPLEKLKIFKQDHWLLDETINNYQLVYFQITTPSFTSKLDFILQGNLPKTIKYELIQMSLHNYSLILGMAEDMLDINSLKNIHTKIMEEFNVKLPISISSRFSELSSIPSAYEKTKSALDYSFVYGIDCAITLETIETNENNENFFISNTYYEELKTAIYKTNLEETEAILEKIIAQISMFKYSNIWAAIINLYKFINNEFQNNSFKESIPNYIFDDFYINIMKMQTLLETKLVFISFFEESFNNINADSTRKIFEKILHHVIAMQFRPNTAKALFHKLLNTFV